MIFEYHLKLLLENTITENILQVSDKENQFLHDYLGKVFSTHSYKQNDMSKRGEQTNKFVKETVQNMKI